MEFVPKPPQCLQCDLCSFRLGTDGHRESVDHDIFLFDPVSCCLSDDLLCDLYSPVRIIRDPVLIQCQSDDHAAVFLDQRKDGIH